MDIPEEGPAAGANDSDSEGLAAFLRGLDPDYGRYAAHFREAGFSKPAELAFVTCEDVSSAAVPVGALRRIRHEACKRFGRPGGLALQPAPFVGAASVGLNARAYIPDGALRAGGGRAPHRPAARGGARPGAAAGGWSGKTSLLQLLHRAALSNPGMFGAVGYLSLADMAAGEALEDALRRVLPGSWQHFATSRAAPAPAPELPRQGTDGRGGGSGGSGGVQLLLVDEAQALTGRADPVWGTAKELMQGQPAITLRIVLAELSLSLGREEYEELLRNFSAATGLGELAEELRERLFQLTAGHAGSPVHAGVCACV
ncbi:hypothetical protein GPECTOR_7g1277 [Gonium pectorale]|uniref:SAM domain-containing protein n=1 Tax=Gonium pectorale TaxID=33097 RepID=A0A150GU86_GONPE|nr:hypothetical protein GPECTOR_7g1277 [Gonium pectorale]|eukprot:KXZ53381.1 hypothetical protein GPECTOR_7g1277 [Gonium pectorale]